MPIIHQQINNVITNNHDYTNFKGQFIYVSFIVNVVQNTSSGNNQLNAINNTDIVYDGNKFVLSYNNTSQPSNPLQPTNPNGIPNNQDGYSFDTSTQSIVLSDRLFTDKSYSDSFFRNNITQSNISFLQLNHTQFNTNNNEIYLIFRCEVDDSGKLITPCFNINSRFIVSDFIFDVQQNADIINSWVIRNVEIHTKPAKEICDIITNRLSDISLFNKQFFRVHILVAPGGLGLGTISQGDLINQTEIIRDVPNNESITFVMHPNVGNKVLSITDSGANILYPNNPFTVNNIKSNRYIIVNFGIDT